MFKNSHPSESAKVFRIGAYLRVSSLRHVTEGDSLESHRNMIQKRIEQRQVTGEWKVASTEFYEDAGRSAKDQDRPQLQRLKADIAAGRINTVVVVKLDRITRSLRDFVGLGQFFQRHGTQIISLSENFDTSGPVGEAMQGIVMVFAQLELQPIAKCRRE